MNEVLIEKYNCGSLYVSATVGGHMIWYGRSVYESLHHFLQLGKSIDNKGICLNKSINLSYVSWITSFIAFVMDFTFADMKFRSHCHDDDEDWGLRILWLKSAVTVSQSFTRVFV